MQHFHSICFQIEWTSHRKSGLFFTQLLYQYAPDAPPRAKRPYDTPSIWGRAIHRDKRHAPIPCALFRLARAVRRTQRACVRPCRLTPSGIACANHGLRRLPVRCALTTGSPLPALSRHPTPRSAPQREPWESPWGPPATMPPPGLTPWSGAWPQNKKFPAALQPPGTSGRCFRRGRGRQTGMSLFTFLQPASA